MKLVHKPTRESRSTGTQLQQRVTRLADLRRRMEIAKNSLDQSSGQLLQQQADRLSQQIGYLQSLIKKEKDHE